MTTKFQDLRTVYLLFLHRLLLATDDKATKIDFNFFFTLSCGNLAIKGGPVWIQAHSAGTVYSFVWSETSDITIPSYFFISSLQTFCSILVYSIHVYASNSRSMNNVLFYILFPAISCFIQKSHNKCIIGWDCQFKLICYCFYMAALLERNIC